MFTSRAGNRSAIVALTVVVACIGPFEQSGPDNAVKRLDVTPLSIETHTVHSRASFLALPHDRYGKVTQDVVGWMGTNPDIAIILPGEAPCPPVFGCGHGLGPIGPYGAKGIIEARRPGTARVTATAGGKSVEVTVVASLVPTGARLATSNPLLAVGDLYPMVGGLTDSAGELYRPRSLTWTSSDPAVATVDSFGEVSAIGTGSTTVTIADGPFTASAAISVPPVPLAFISLAADPGTTCGMVTDGRAYCWGYKTPFPYAVHPGQRFRSMVRADVFCALGTDGLVYCPPPTPIPGGVKLQLAVGNCGLQLDGQAYCWGGPLVTKSPGAVPFVALAGGQYHYCALSIENDAYCWGNNQYGQLGNGATSNSETAALVQGNHKWSSIAAGYRFSCGITVTHEAYCWGLNHAAQLGGPPSDYVASPDPTPVPGAPPLIEISAHWEQVCGLTIDGTAYCWGNYVGTPTPVLAQAKFVSLTTGGAQACGLTARSGVYCWGSNYDGELGNGTFATSPIANHVLGTMR